ncbi:MAG TPA: sugar phosphate isomerase/epimerase [Candidatus Eisenbergiella merdipullorum]|uniref:Sugar phosphate isomerase/epimerase n=1 Tax=Candidatus Eisenbergiella merdipullorum TaxID=2838553 RepID=A0A9D2L1L3_9FIRM|nr:sugar phosphate isomerase/epimerase [Candidatus Eisenbergiella merdipullorum]
MKLSFSTLGCPDWTFAQIIENANEMGYDAVELRGVGNQLRMEELECMQSEKRDDIRNLLEKNHVGICVAGTSVQFHNAEGYQDALQEGRCALKLCTELGIPFIRVFGNIFPEGEPREAVMRRVEEGISRLCDYAFSLQPSDPVQVLLEIHGDFNSLPALVPLCDALQGEPGFGLIWDVFHSWLWHGDDFIPFYEALRSWIRHVHVKDCTLENGKPELCLPGEGVIPLKAMIKRLQQDGYDGYYSFEWEKRWHPELLSPELALPAYISFMRVEAR